MEALGLVPSTCVSRPARHVARCARRPDYSVIESSVDILIDGVEERREHWLFIARERSSGLAVLRYAIRTEIRLITSELATTWPLPRPEHLEQRGPQHPRQRLRRLDDRDRRIARGRPRPATIEEIRRMAIKQLRMITVGVAGWQSS